MDFNIAQSNPDPEVDGENVEMLATAMHASDAGTRVEHYATDQPTPTGEADELQGGWYFYKA